MFSTLPLALGCAGSASVDKTLDERGTGSFRNVLVIAVAADYDGRAMFERGVASRIRSSGSSATAYYRIKGNDPQVEREGVLDLVLTHGFDAVLLTRVKDQELEATVKDRPTEMRATTMGGRPFNFFRYDYEEFNQPAAIDLKSSVVLTTELYSAADQRKVWSIETTSRNKANIGELVDSSADAIVRRLERDRLIGD